MTEPVNRSEQMTKLLESLADIHPPASVSIWPVAPIWWIVIVVSSGGLLLLARAVFHRLVSAPVLQSGKTRQYFQDIFDQYCIDNDTCSYFSNCNRYLKTVAMRNYPSSELASMTGSTWSTWLAHNTQSVLSDFVQEGLSKTCYKNGLSEHEEISLQHHRELIEIATLVSKPKRGWLSYKKRLSQGGTRITAASSESGIKNMGIIKSGVHRA